MANLNKEWMQCSNRLSDTYTQGVTEFLDYAYKYIQSDEKISCPCVRCNNVYLKMRDDVEADLVIYGIAPSYTRWALHGEDVYNEENSEDEVDRDGSDESDDFEGMVHDGCGVPNFSIDQRGSSEFPNNTSMEDNPDERSILHRLMHQLNSNLYPGCDGYSKLSFLVRLWHLKCINRLSNTAFESLLHLFKSALPEGETLPNSFYEARKIIRDLGLDYLNLAGKQAFCKYLKDARLPDGFCSNISRCVYENEGKIIGLKSHDCHVLIQHLLPIAIRGRLEKKLVEALTELAIFFKELTSKTLWGHELEKLQDSLAITMCKLEMLFPPSFFDIMVHLPIHLAMEAKIAGPVQYRWMYPIERYLRTLKSYVRNKGHPEGSIAEAYIADECLTFCSRYLKKHGTTTPNRRMNHFDLPNPSFEVLSVFAERSNLNHYDNDSKIKGTRLLSRDELSKAHLYVIKNCDEVLPFLQEYEEIGRSAGFGSSWNTCSFDFCDWFQEIATKLYSEKNDRVSEHLYGLACGPQQVVTVYDAHTVNGFKFRTQERDKDKLTQNSGVFVKGIAGSMDMEYYGILRNIIGLRYVGRQEIILFECTWWDVYNEGRGYEKDMFGYLSLNPKRQLATDEPYILAKQAQQAVFLPDNVNKGWVIALKSEPRDYYDVDNDPEESEFNPPTSHEYGESSGVAN